MSSFDSTGERFRRSYRRGLIIFIYGLIWLTAGYAALLATGQFFPTSDSLPAVLVSSLWASAWVGGLAGTAAMLQRLGQSLVVAPHFLQQSLLPYLARPLVGLGAGVISLVVVVLPGTLLINFATTRSLALVDSFSSPTTVAVQLLLAGIAGYYLWSGLKQFEATPPAADVGADLASAQVGDRKGSPLRPILSGSEPLLTNPPASDEAPFDFKVWAEQHQEMMKWSLTWGLVIFFYGLVWLLALLVSLIGNGSLFMLADDLSQPAVRLASVAWSTIAAGGIGGVMGMFYHLYHHISMQQDFHRQHVMNYLIRPPLGLVFGACIYLFIGSGYLSLESLSTTAPTNSDVPFVLALQLVLGWVVGFRPQTLLNLVRWVVQALNRFFRSILSVLAPRLLWDKTSRADALNEVSQQAELFRPLERNRLRRKP